MNVSIFRPSDVLCQYPFLSFRPTVPKKTPFDVPAADDVIQVDFETGLPCARSASRFSRSAYLRFRSAFAERAVFAARI
ncbi:hypothetical protein [Rhizobium ruizarguesonis]|uniref:hypothetical protein n=1 Tax=Rhizobium ruizarguesonis TaxID=2081791 RepID=UPI00144779E9|nr:hypothetical protein [Rhizobium ruizarguesonis]